MVMKHICHKIKHTQIFHCRLRVVNVLFPYIKFTPEKEKSKLKFILILYLHGNLISKHQNVIQ